MDPLLAIAPVVIPALGAVVHAVAGWRPGTAPVATVSAAFSLLAAVLLAGRVVADGPLRALGVLRIDAVSAFMLLVISVVALIVAVATPAHVAAELDAGRIGPRTATWQAVLVQAFLAAMALAVTAADLGVLWVAVEATTIVTAFLVGQRRTRSAVEAAWKYVVICSAGIALALLGIVLLNHASAHSGTGAGLDWAALAEAAPRLDPDVTRVAVVLLVVGFGAKAGLAPLHAWLPDAHSQAPAPVSALMSGVLLSVAFSAILRVKVISDGALGVGFARALLLAAALASLLVAASLLIAQRDYKRMLAYSSIEHMGLLALGAAAGGPLATAAVLLHVLGHGMAKSVLFLGAGRLLQITGTSSISGIRALAARQPVLAGAFGAGILALLGLPPFSLFASELGIVRAGFAAGIGWATAAALALVVVIGAALVTHTGRMLLGSAPEGPGAAAAPRRVPRTTAAALIAGLLGCAALGTTAGPLDTLLELAAETLTGAP
ncbi:proton-conducting transporter membrane subunit [Pseudonocardia sp. MH-G8]|uniref:proton-conducting transporter transmembrane domain-containing protein n=1 Tax=Pseudonocardia sp. MH-G8 TaxID=1854588 RepID=UPI000BA0D956|nr:proton-conducting transporter membrane subunit [Pseudonocardia sp. MH-G8]OZM81735.1 hydrogenase [Pseudonocardia sp. MH-G8]